MNRNRSQRSQSLKTLSLPGSIQLTQEQIGYLEKMVIEAGEDMGDFKSNR